MLLESEKGHGCNNSVDCKARRRRKGTETGGRGKVSSEWNGMESNKIRVCLFIGLREGEQQQRSSKDSNLLLFYSYSACTSKLTLLNNVAFPNPPPNIPLFLIFNYFKRKYQTRLLGSYEYF